MSKFTIQRIIQKMHSISQTNTHQDIETFEVDGTV